MSEKQFCPKAIENGLGPKSPFRPPFNGEMEWGEDDTCSYCGSLSPDVFMARLEAGDIQLGPTFERYKVYVLGARLFRMVRTCPPGVACSNPKKCAHWIKQDMPQGKFYFHHLSQEQRDRFIVLHNEGKIKFGYPGHFYVPPFFCASGRGEG